ncbi:hypothetical protein pEaSNUABM6_00009 [Erwinia phage pEa_SNUABM_6]|nr:hypothetical protein pEaSNUABM6_00009 [Erwinia phage pEa_SNUABM_6]
MGTYHEGPESTVTHRSHEYSVDALLDIAERHSLVQIPVSRIEWILNETTLEDERVKSADTDYPIIVLHEGSLYIVLDGAHRLAKAVAEGKDTIAAKILVPANLPKPVR